MTTPVNILLVDDEPRNLDVLEGVLQSPEHRLVRAGHAEAALLALLQGDFAVIVLDIQMPGMSGLELAHLIKQRAKTQDIPIIFLTALYDNEARMLESYHVGAVDYLTKPVNPQVLRSKIAVFVDLFRKTNALEKTNAALELEIRQRQEAERLVRQANDELEARVEARTAALRDAHAEAERAGRAKDEFLAALSHELRTPLNPVLLLASEGAANMSYPEDVRRDLATIRKNVELEARLIDDMLDLTRITRGKLTLNRQPGDVHLILHDALATVREEIAQKQIALEVELRAPRVIVEADSVRLQQVFWNILKNAVKFTPKGGRIRVASRVESDGDRIVLSVQDDGIGLTAGEIERIFEAFAQGNHAESGSSHTFGGLGLGLAISRRLTEFHHGSLRAESEGPGRGATFSISLPLASPGRVAAAPAPVPAATHSPSVAGATKTPQRILLVEDHEATRQTLAAMLVQRRYRVSSASSLTEARQLARKLPFDILISDIGLPDGTGFELMTEMSRDYGVAGIALTGYGMDDDIKQSRDAGFSLHLTKPIVMQSLDQALEALDRERTKTPPIAAAN